MESNPERIDLRVLSKYPELHEFRRERRPLPDGGVEPDEIVPSDTPEERIEVAYLETREALTAELLDRIRRQTPEFFEQLVLDVLVAMGYGGSRKDAAARLGRSGDAGIDGVIQEDRLGLDLIYLQAKRWENPVGRPTVQAFVGALQGARASKGVLITSSSFTQEAQTYADSVSPRVILLDGVHLADLMIDHNVGAAPMTQYVLMKIDEDYFGIEDELVGT
jgi:restriction system protein